MALWNRNCAQRPPSIRSPSAANPRVSEMKTVLLVFILINSAFAGAKMSDKMYLQGVIDFHAHCHPDSRARSIDAIDLARKAREAGMRGLVLKNHYAPTAGLAYLTRKVVPGVEVFGGVVLNLSLGGINGNAVEVLAATEGGLGKVVWMPTFDAENHVRFFKEDRPYVKISSDGKLLPEVQSLIRLIAEKGLVLATGHSSPEECLLLIRMARRAGVKGIVVTHAMADPVRMSIAQQKEAAELGAFIEHTFLPTIQGPNAPIASMRNWSRVTAAEYAAAIKAVGAEHCILSSDLGQAGNPLHTDGLRDFIASLRSESTAGGNAISEREIELMTRTNPAKLLGLK